MTDVIPPGTLYSIHPFDQYSNEQNNLWKQLFLLLDQLYLRTGGTTDDTSSLGEKINSVENQSAMLQAIVSQFIDDTEYYSISSDRTTEGNEFIRATASCTITLNSNPEDGEKVWIQPSVDELVTVSGDINDQSSMVIHRAYDVMHLVYISDAGEWVIQ